MEFAYYDEIKKILDEEGRLTRYPKKFKHKVMTWFYLADTIEPGKSYSEKEVNELLKARHTFADWVMLRRALCDGGFWERTNDGSAYQRAETLPTMDRFGL